MMRWVDGTGHIVAEKIGKISTSGVGGIKQRMRLKRHREVGIQVPRVYEQGGIVHRMHCWLRPCRPEAGGTVMERTYFESLWLTDRISVTDQFHPIRECQRRLLALLQMSWQPLLECGPT